MARDKNGPYNKTKNLVVAQSNIEKGITNPHKVAQIESSLMNNGVDMFVLNETGLNKGISSSSLQLPSNYVFVRMDRGHNGGGVGVLINKNLDYEEHKMSTPSKFRDIEAIWIHIKNPSIYVCGFYRTNNYTTVEHFIEYMEFCMGNLSNKKVLWIGDINIDQKLQNSRSNEYKKLHQTLRQENYISRKLYLKFVTFIVQKYIINKKRQHQYMLYKK